MTIFKKSGNHPCFFSDASKIQEVFMFIFFLMLQSCIYLWLHSAFTHFKIWRLLLTRKIFFSSALNFGNFHHSCTFAVISYFQMKTIHRILLWILQQSCNHKIIFLLSYTTKKLFFFSFFSNKSNHLLLATSVGSSSIVSV